MKRRTWILDIDGTIFYHHQKGATTQWSGPPDLLPGVKEFFDAAEKRGDCIVLITARKEACREETAYTLRRHGLFWDTLVMGVGSGERIVVNDFKPGSSDHTANGITIERNKGLGCLMNYVVD